MIPLFVAALIVAGLGERPAAILGTDGKDGYLAKLEQKLDNPVLHSFVATAIPNCPNMTYTAAGFKELQSRDFGPVDDFYTTTAVKPAIIEHVLAAGCGKQVKLNILAARLLATPGDLKLSFQMAGDTRAGLQLQRDTYSYVAMATNVARTMAGNKEPCTQSPMVLDTQVTVEPNNGAPWHEIWSTAVCGFNARIAVDYVPDGQGTKIGARPMKPGE